MKHLKYLSYLSKPTIDFKNKGVNIGCEQWAVAKFEVNASIFGAKIIYAAAFNQVNLVKFNFSIQCYRYTQLCT